MALKMLKQRIMSGMSQKSDKIYQNQASCKESFSQDDNYQPLFSQHLQALSTKHLTYSYFVASFLVNEFVLFEHFAVTQVGLDGGCFQ